MLDAVKQKRKFILLDRDDTLNFDPGYIRDPDIVALKPEVLPGLQMLALHGYHFVVLTNQSGIGRGWIRPEELEAVHARLSQLLRAGGISIERFYVCPHRDEDECRCRKPRPGLVEQAIQDYPEILEGGAYLVGDKLRDIAAGESFNIPGILVYTKEDFRSAPRNFIHSAENLLAAAQFLLDREKKK